MLTPCPTIIAILTFFAVLIRYHILSRERLVQSLTREIPPTKPQSKFLSLDLSPPCDIKGIISAKTKEIWTIDTRTQDLYPTCIQYFISETKYFLVSFFCPFFIHP
jgi:hypothetical protein